MMKKFKLNALTIATGLAMVVASNANALAYVWDDVYAYTIHANNDGTNDTESLTLSAGSGSPSSIILKPSGGVSISSTTGTSITGSATVSTTLGVTGAATLSSTLGVTGATTLSSTLGVTGATTLSSTLDVTGTTNINTSGTAATNIGNATGATSINAGVAGTTNIGTGNVASTTNIGSSNGGSTVTLQGGDSGVSLSNGTARIAAGTASGYTAYSTAQTVGTDVALSNGNAASQALVEGAAVNNVINGNTLVDGNMYINGTLVYSSNTSAATTVTDSSSGTVGSLTVANAGQASAVVDANGKITAATATEATAALTVQNQLGNTHGIVVQESKTTISGGNTSSSLTMDDRGATFSESSTGAPITVTGVANGKADFDAVNVRQFAGAIAAVTAQSNIPTLAAGQDSVLGLGFGSFMGKSALAVGLNMRGSDNTLFRASLASGLNDGGKSATLGMGVGWSF